MKEAIDKLLKAKTTSSSEIPDDCYRGEDGLLYCANCHGKRERVVMLLKEQVVPCLCPCEVEAQERQEKAWREKDREMMIRRFRETGLSDPAYYGFTFEADLEPKSKLSKVSRSYVESFDENYKEGLGLLYTGPVGVGKSFYACCIANALIDRGIPVMVTSIPRVLNRLRATQDEQEVISEIMRQKLLVLDDFGAERQTEYALEKIFTLFDEWTLSGKPMIVTTNLSYEDLLNPKDPQNARIYDRLLARSIPLSVTGESKRLEQGKGLLKKFKDRLGL